MDAAGSCDPAGHLPAILIRYLGHVTVCRVVVPRSGQNFARPAETNFVDKLVWKP